MGYFAQHAMEVLEGERTVFQTLEDAFPQAGQAPLRALAGCFGFSGDEIEKKCRVLSGGEKARLVMALMLFDPPNLLVLDEPTNHLDLDSKEVLLEALADYGGTMVFVSHDRYFVDKLATKVVEVGNGQALLYPGGYEDFLYWKKQQELGLAAPLPTTPRPHVSHAPKAQPAVKMGTSNPRPAETVKQHPQPPKAAKPAAAPSYDPLAPRLRPPTATDSRARDNSTRKARARLAELEKLIGDREQRVKDVEAQMASPGFYDDRARADEAVTNRQKLLDEVNTLMSEWESLQAAVEVKG